MEYDLQAFMSMWRDGLLTHAEMINWLVYALNEVNQEALRQETEAAEKTFKAQGIIKD